LISIKGFYFKFVEKPAVIGGPAGLHEGKSINEKKKEAELIMSFVVG
jgi:hypothetical protein